MARQRLLDRKPIELGRQDERRLMGRWVGAMG
jgi:hypothetical protein